MPYANNLRTHTLIVAGLIQIAALHPDERNRRIAWGQCRSGLQHAIEAEAGRPPTRQSHAGRCPTNCFHSLRWQSVSAQTSSPERTSMSPSKPCGRPARGDRRGRFDSRPCRRASADGGAARERFVYAPDAGRFVTSAPIGDRVEEGAVVATIGHVSLRAPIGGVLRGLTRSGVNVTARTKGH